MFKKLIWSKVNKLINDLQEIVPNVANFEGNLRKMSNKKKGSSAVAFVGKRKGGEGDTFKAFSADYHSPKRHPPKNNWLRERELRERERAIFPLLLL